MKLFSLPKRTKSLTYTAFIVSVLGVFLLGYFYYYVPTNKQTIHKDGFLILRTIAGNIIDKNTDRQNLYKNFINEAQRKKPEDPNAYVETLLGENNIDASARYVRRSGRSQQKSQRTDGESTPAQLSVKGEDLVYRVRLGAANLVVTEGVADFLQPILVTQKAELFDAYALACIDSTGSKLLYHDDNLGIRSDVRLDTLLARNVQGYLTGVRDINAPDFNHKIFHYPFKVGSIQFVLCGFARLDLYNQNVRKVPYRFVYPLAITFLLLLVFLPGLKFYIMDADEQVQVHDVILFGASVFVGASVLTLIIIQYLLWQGEEGSARRNLKTLSDQIERNFIDELKEAYAQADTLDAFRKAHASLADPALMKKTVDFSDSVRQFLRRSPHYYHFDRISWVDKRDGDNAGKQMIKAELVGKPVFTNVKSRNYFRVFRDNDLFLLPGRSDAAKPFGWEPIYSQTNADFNMTISKQTGNYVVALASKMYSVVNTLLPVGYGFCIIDGSGKVLVHSNVNRNLRENLFEKVEPASALQGFAAARQEEDINEVVLYRNWHMLHIRPIRNLPYSLVTFYDKGFIVPVNMRILIFAFLFSVLSAMTCVLLWLALAYTGLRKHPLLYCPMDYLTWLIPQRKQDAYYRHGLWFLGSYIVALIAFNLLPLSAVSSYTRFSVVLLTPISVICGLYVIKASFWLSGRRLAGNEAASEKIRPLRIAGVHLLLSFAFLALSAGIGYPIGWPFLLFQGVVNGSMWVWYNRTINRKISPATPEEGNNYQTNYTLLLTGLVICLSVLPSALYSWYGYNQECVQTVKKQQLHFANAIRDRSRLLMTIAGFTDPTLVTKAYITDRFVKRGIYTVNHDAIDLRGSAPRDPGPGLFERLYFTVAENLSNRYYDPKRYPALADSSADRSWQWQWANGSVYLWYQNPLHERTDADPNHQYLYMASPLPGSYLFSPDNRGWAISCLALLGGLLLWGVYTWLRINSENVFLAKYVNAHEPEPHANPLYPWAVDDTYTAYRHRARLHVHEKDVLRMARQDQTRFQGIWDAGTPKEKYLLHDFAHDGLLNYKNPDEIHNLIEQKIFTVEDERLRFVDAGFRAFIMKKHGTDEIKQLHAQYQRDSTWKSLQGPLLLSLVGFAGFVFFTQEEAFNKILALAGGVTTLLSLLPKLLGEGNSKAQPTTQA